MLISKLKVTKRRLQKILFSEKCLAKFLWQNDEDSLESAQLSVQSALKLPDKTRHKRDEEMIAVSFRN